MYVADSPLPKGAGGIYIQFKNPPDPLKKGEFPAK